MIGCAEARSWLCVSMSSAHAIGSLGRMDPHHREESLSTDLGIMRESSPAESSVWGGGWWLVVTREAADMMMRLSGAGRGPLHRWLACHVDSTVEAEILLGARGHGPLKEDCDGSLRGTKAC